MSVKPWHQHCLLRDDVRTGKMTLERLNELLEQSRPGWKLS